MNWVIFSLLSRALYAADNIIDKVLIGKYLKDSVVLTLLYGVFPAFLSIGIIVFNGLNSIGLKPVVLAIFAGAIQVPAIFALILSFLFLGEVLTITYYFAFMLILIGGFLISLQKIQGVFKLRNAFW